MSGAAQMPAQQRNREQALLGEKTKLQGKGAVESRDVHVAGMICHHDVAGAGIERFGAPDCGAHETDGQQHPRPLPGEPMLRASGAVPQRADVGNEAHPGSQDDDCGGGEQNCAQFPHGSIGRLRSLVND